MSKVYYFITMTIGLTILMRLAGIPYAGETQILEWLGLDINNVYTTTSAFYLMLVAPLGFFVIAAGIGAVFSNKEAALRAGIAAGIMGVGMGTFIGILQYVQNVTRDTPNTWIFSLVFLIFSTYIVGWIFAMLEWWSTGQ
jgi:hypothetical protein